MSANLNTDSGQASNPNPAATDSNVSADNAAVDTAASSAERTGEVAATGSKDASIEDLDRQYKENILAADKPEPDTAQPEKTQLEPEKVEAKTDETVEVEEPETETLEEQTGPRTIEQLKKQFPRVSDKPLEEIARVEAEHFKLQQEVDAVGGTIGLEIAKSVVPALLSANPTDEEVDNVFQGVTETNPGLMQRMSWSILTHSLNEKTPDPATGIPINIVTGNAIIKQFLNEKYDVESLEKLIAYDEAGLLDHEELATELESFTGKSKRELELEERLKALETGKEQEKAAESTKTEARIQQHIAKTEDYVSKGAMTQIVAIAQEYGWTATKEELASSDPAVKELAEFKVALGELLTPWLDSFVRNHVKWGGIQEIGKTEQAFNADGNPTRLLKSNGDALINAAVAAFKSKVRVMNATFKKVAGSSRAVKLKEKTTRSGAVDPSEIPPVKKPESNGNRPPGDEFARLDEEYRRAVRG